MSSLLRKSVDISALLDGAPSFPTFTEYTAQCIASNIRKVHITRHGAQSALEAHLFYDRSWIHETGQIHLLSHDAHYLVQHTRLSATWTLMRQLNHPPRKSVHLQKVASVIKPSSCFREVKLKFWLDETTQSAFLFKMVPSGVVAKAFDVYGFDDGKKIQVGWISVAPRSVLRPPDTSRLYAMRFMDGLPLELLSFCFWVVNMFYRRLSHTATTDVQLVTK